MAEQLNNSHSKTFCKITHCYLLKKKV